MNVWEFKHDDDTVNDVAGLVHARVEDLYSGLFDAVGEPLPWKERPQLTVEIEPRRKKPKPRVDMSLLSPGSFVLNAKAKSVLGDFLSKFGELLPLDCDGAIEYFYNVLCVIDCIDIENSALYPEGTIEKVAFFEDKVPIDPSIFKVPEKIGGAIYANDGAKNLIETLMSGGGITGARFYKITPSKRARRKP